MWGEQVRRAERARKRRRGSARKRLRRRLAQPLAGRKCPDCGKPAGNPFGHVCVQGGGFAGKRRAAERKAKREKEAAAAKAKRDAARARETAARRRRREKEDEARRARRLREIQAAKARAARAKRKPPPRRGRPQHDYRNCRDADCERVACEAYREGRADEAEAQEAQ